MRVTMEKALRAKEEELDKMRRDLLREMEQIQVSDNTVCPIRCKHSHIDISLITLIIIFKLLDN